MTVIEIPDEQAAALKAKAAAQGFSLEGWLKNLAQDGTGEIATDGDTGLVAMPGSGERTGKGKRSLGF